jgi:hypothetical protein
MDAWKHGLTDNSVGIGRRDGTIPHTSLHFAVVDHITVPLTVSRK